MKDSFHSPKLFGCARLEECSAVKVRQAGSFRFGDLPVSLQVDLVADEDERSVVGRR